MAKLNLSGIAVTLCKHIFAAKPFRYCCIMDANGFWGGLYGVAIGDALGAAHEFARSSPKVPYTGILTDVKVSVHFQFHAMVIEPCSITDDTEMTIQLLKAIVKNRGKYVETDVIKSYLDWANLKNTPLGKNTRALMKGVTTVPGFYKRQAKVASISQSNGTLMRCFPLVLIKENWKDASNKDVNISNNNPVNRACNIVYLSIIRSFVYDESLNIKLGKDVDVVRTAIKNAINGVIVDVAVDKGWVVHALYVALITFLHTSSFDEGMDYIHCNFFGTLKFPSDTDTIMAITGGLLGAYYGFCHLTEQKNTSQNLLKICERN